ncbi:MAG: hypothetical protein GY760_03410 [Deltaproteobacteria bacterium]|nr:hypothetical protein [Deltaproteobacteria bacterium]
MDEIWKDIKGYEGIYKVSNLGNVRSLDRYVGFKVRLKRKGQLLTPRPGSGKKIHYKFILSDKNGKRKEATVQILVAGAFLPPQPAWSDCLQHIDGDCKRNEVRNLKWWSLSKTQNEIIERGRKHIAPATIYPEKYTGSANARARAVVVSDKEGKEINQFGSIKEASESLKVSWSTIDKRCRKLIKSRDGYNYDYGEG